MMLMILVVMLRLVVVVVKKVWMIHNYGDCPGIRVIVLDPLVTCCRTSNIRHTLNMLTWDKQRIAENSGIEIKVWKAENEVAIPDLFLAFGDV